MGARLAPDLNTTLDQARQFYFDGKVAEAIDSLEELEKRADKDAFALQQIAALYIQCSQHEKAGRCYARAVELQPANADFLYNLGASRTATGDLDEAERIFNKVINLNPSDYGAWLSRSGLRRQTAESNHVEQLLYVKSQLRDDDPGQVQVCHALAKELEDLGRHEEAFAFLQEGAHKRRLGMQYDVAEDERAMSEIANTFGREALQAPDCGYPSERPVFILGLPRSGTTLVDRIISSHSQVDSLGEHNSLPLALVGLAGQHGKLDLIRRSAAIDFAELGRRYCESIGGFGNPAPRLVDKTPPNFLYMGLIRRALPNARIIHLRRHPMDICYAIYKTLFRVGYPFSYSLQEVGRYYIAYHRLMQHWREVMPDGFIDVNYEDVVADLEGESRRIFDYLGLDWEEDCLRFHRLKSAAATASAAQVRQPIYSSSVGLWRKYERQLAPFAARLRERGIEFD